MSQTTQCNKRGGGGAVWSDLEKSSDSVLSHQGEAPEVNIMSLKISPTSHN